MDTPRQHEVSDGGHVFLSCRHQDAGFVRALEKKLAGGHLLWVDTSEIRGGQAWRERIVRTIAQAHAFLLVVSPETQASKEVYAEYFYTSAVTCR